MLRFFLEYLTNKKVRYSYNPSNNTIRTDSIGSDNFNGLIISLDKLNYYDFKTNESGGLLDFLEKLFNCSKNFIINDLRLFIMDKETIVNYNYNYKNDIEHTKKEVLIYPINLLELYPVTISSMLLEDGINEITQAMFDIRYDEKSDRILIPIKFKKNLVGLIGRYNNLNCPKELCKYLPILTYPKSEVLFGYDILVELYKGKTVILVESEKSVMKSFQVGIYNTLAVGGSNISISQINLLKELNISNIFICFDSDKELKDLIKLKEKRFSNNEFKVKVVNNNTEKVYNKSCIFDMSWNKIQIMEYIKKYSI